MEKLEKKNKEILLKLLQKSTPHKKTMFKRMFSHGHLESPIETVVENIESDKIQFAISYLERTIHSDHIIKTKVNGFLNEFKGLMEKYNVTFSFLVSNTIVAEVDNEFVKIPFKNKKNIPIN